MRPAIAVSCALSIIVPVLSWWDLHVPGRTILAVVFVLIVPGTPLMTLLLDRPRAVLWMLIPAVSIASTMVITVAQVVTGTWSEPITASLLALCNVLCAARAWKAASPLHSVRALLPRFGRPRAVSVVTMIVAGALWWWAITAVDLDAAGAAGIVTVLPWSYWLGLSLMAIVAGAAIVRKPAPDNLIAGAAITALAIMIAIFVGVADGGSPVGTAYVHVGFVDWISETGTLREATDARFSWPGFFTSAAAVSAWAGLGDAMPLVVYFPVVATLLCLTPVWVIGMVVFGHRALAWTGVLLFVLGNWVQQDYFAPQAIAFPLMLSVIAVLLWQTSASGLPENSRHGVHRALTPLLRTPARVPELSFPHALALEGTLFCIVCAIIVSHQLTPVSLIVTLLALSMLGATRSRTLWFGASVAFAAWFAFGATDWWTGHLSVIIEGFGNLDEAVDSGVVGRVSGDPIYQTMQTARIGWAGLFAVAGLVGWLITRGGRLPMPVSAALVIAPGTLILGQPYGGEVVLRVYLYALPILAVLAAGGISSLVRSRHRLSRIAFVFLVVACAACVTVARGVNVAFERTPADVLVTARTVLWQTPTDSTIRPLAAEGALRTARLGQLHQPPSVEGDGSAFARLLVQDPDVVFLTSTREHFEQITAGAQPDWYDHVVTLLEASGRYQVTHRTEHVTVLQRVRTPAEEARR